MPNLPHVQASIPVSNSSNKSDGPPEEAQESTVNRSSTPLPTAHLEAAGLALLYASKESQELDALKRLLPRYLHDLKNVFARLVICTDHLVGDCEKTKLPQPLRDFTEYSSFLMYNQRNNNFSKWEEFVTQETEDKQPPEVLEEARKMGRILEGELNLKINVLIQYIEAHETDDPGMSHLLKNIKLSGSEILTSINNFNSAESYLNYKGKVRTLNPFDELNKFIQCSKLTPVGKILTLQSPMLQGAPLLISIDPNLFISSIENMLRNAAKAAVKAHFPPGQSEFKTTITNGDGKVQIILEDTGPGMPEEYLRKIRTGEEFSDSLGESKGKGGGTNQGFGIQNVIRNIELAGGKVLVDSSQDPNNHFTRFTIELPAISPIVEPAVNNSDSNESLEIASVKDVVTVQNDTSPAKTILIVRKYGGEDIAKILKQSREKEYKIVVAKTFEEALVLTKQHKPELIVSEFTPPGSDQNACGMLEQIVSVEGKLPKVIFVRTGMDLQLDGVRTYTNDPGIFELDEIITELLNTSAEKK